MYSVYIYIYIYISKYMCVYMYIYIYISSHDQCSGWKCACLHVILWLALHTWFLPIGSHISSSHVHVALLPNDGCGIVHLGILQGSHPWRLAASPDLYSLSLSIYIYITCCTYVYVYIYICVYIIYDLNTCRYDV